MSSRTVITGTGCFIPPHIRTNQDFINQSFFSEDGVAITTPIEETISKLSQITGITERRYADDAMNTSDMGTNAARVAIEESGIDVEQIDQMIFAHNFGNVVKHTIQTDVFLRLRPALSMTWASATPIVLPMTCSSVVRVGCRH